VAGREASVYVILRRAIVLLLAAASLASAQDADSSGRSIAAALRDKNYQQALDLSRSALQHSPKDPKILTMEGIALSGLGKDKEALGAYNEALNASPEYVPALEGAAQIEYKAGSDRGVVLLKRLLAIHPDDPTSHAMLAVLAYQRHDCKSAAENFAKSGELLSTQPVSLREYGACLMRLQKPEDAIEVFEKLVAAAPDDSHARLDLAAAQFLAHHSQDAINTLQPTLEGENSDPEALDLASQAYEDLDDTPHAVKLLRQAIILAPQNPSYYLDFATLSFNHSSYQVGVDVLNAGLAQLPKDASLYAARGILYIQMADFDKGEADLETAERLDPKQTFSSDAEGLGELQAHDPEEALAAVRTRLKSHPNDAFLHFLLAQILIQKGAAVGSADFAEAVRAAERAEQLNPELVTARDLLGDLFLKSGQISKSIAESRAALRADSSDQSALYHLVQALRNTNQKDEIPDLLKRLVVLREETRKKEEARSRYKLMEPGQAAGGDAKP
jgi:tetratricopeptide (TPR) repeat protein